MRVGRLAIGCNRPAQVANSFARSTLFVLIPALLLVPAMGAAQQAAPGGQKAQITILYDAFGKPSGMRKDWGFSALIEYGGKRILFDTGDNPDVLANNAKVAQA